MELHPELVSTIAEHFKVDPEDINPGSGPTKGDIQQWDSFGHIALLLKLEETFKIKFTTEEIAELASAEMLQTRLNSEGVLS